MSFVQAMYEAFSGTSKGMIYRDLLCGVVLLANGNNNEKAKCKLYTIISPAWTKSWISVF